MSAPMHSESEVINVYKALKERVGENEVLQIAEDFPFKPDASPEEDRDTMKIISKHVQDPFRLALVSLSKKKLAVYLDKQFSLVVALAIIGYWYSCPGRLGGIVNKIVLPAKPSDQISLALVLPARATIELEIGDCIDGSQVANLISSCYKLISIPKTQANDLESNLDLLENPDKRTEEDTYLRLDTTDTSWFLYYPDIFNLKRELKKNKSSVNFHVSTLKAIGLMRGLERFYCN